MLCFLADEAGSEFNSEFRPSASKDNNFVFDVLTRLHARSCQITSEIILLLRSGFADGAHVDGGHFMKSVLLDILLPNMGTLWLKGTFATLPLRSSKQRMHIKNIVKRWVTKIDCGGVRGNSRKI